MGIYINPGNTAFRKALNSEIYIDKTDLIAAANRRTDTINCFMCASISAASENPWRRICWRPIAAKGVIEEAVKN